MGFSIIAAVDKNLGIGKDNHLPWRLPTDLRHFSEVTTGAGKNAVIMGRRTWESLPGMSRPLVNRLNIVVTSRRLRGSEASAASLRSDLSLPTAVKQADSLESALALARMHNCEEAFVIGGEKLFHAALSHPDLRTMYLTEIDGTFNCDVFFPAFDVSTFGERISSKTHAENGVNFRFVMYTKNSAD